MIGVFIALAVLFAGAVSADIYLGRHPLRKLDKKGEKFRYRGW